MLVLLVLGLVVVIASSSCAPRDVQAVRAEGEGEGGEGEGEAGEGEGEAGEGEGESEAGEGEGEGEGEAGEGEGEGEAGEGEPEPCDAPTAWTCDGDARTRCGDALVIETEPCAGGCRDAADSAGNARCMSADPTWQCEDSAFQGTQYWTCSGAAVHACVEGEPMQIACESGCVFGPLATDDRCTVPGDVPVDLPALDINISGGLFSENDVRPLLEQGLASMLERLYTRVAIPADRELPDVLTINFSPSNNAFCSGIAFADSTDVSCPFDYPIAGDNQNLVVNITMHELGHLIALHLIGPASERSLCANEGIATWIASDYWANFQSQPVGTLQEAARREIAAGRAPESLQSCVSASDPHYKVYGSFFDYLDTEVPGGVMSVGSGAESDAVHEAAWQDWL